MATIDSLDIRIEGSAQKANVAINDLITNLGRLANSLKIDTRGLEKIGKINGNNFKKIGDGLQSFSNAARSLQGVDSNNFNKLSHGLSKIASIDPSKLEALGKIDGNSFRGLGEGIKSLSAGMQNLQGIKTKEFTTVAKGIEKLAAIQPGNMETVGNALRPLADGVNILSNAKFDNKNLQNLINSLTRLSNANTGSLANIDFTALGNSINGLSQTLSKAEEVKQNTISMTNAVAKLANSGENANITSQALPQLGLRLKEFINSMSDAPKLEAETITFTQALAQLANAGKKAESTASGLPKLGESLKNIFDTMSKMPSISSNTIKMTQALAQLASAGGRAGASTAKLNGKINTLSSSMLGVKVSTKKAVSGLKSLGKQLLSSMGIYLGIYGAMRGISRAIDISSDLTEVQNVVDVTFGNMAYKVEEFAETSIEQFGMSELALKQYSSRFQAMGSAMGIDSSLIKNANDNLSKLTGGYVSASDSMSDVSLNLTKLTADMASFYNVEQKVVAEDLAAIFTGQTRPLRDYGLDLTQATLAEWAMKNGLDANIQSMSQAEKTMLRYQYVLANTKAAQGDFARTANTWANQVRILKQKFEQLASVLGGVFINALKPLVKGLNAAMSHIISFAKTVSNALGQIFGWKFEEGGGGIAQDFEDTSGAIGGASDGAGKLSGNLGKAEKNAKKLKTHMLGIDELNVVSKDNELPSGGSGGTGGGTGDGTGNESAGGALGGQWIQGESILKKFESEIDSLFKLGRYISDTLSEALESIDWKSVYKKAEKFGTGLADFLNGLITPRLFGNVGKTIAGALNTALHFLDSFGKTFNWKNFGNSIATGVNKFFETFDFELLANTINVWANGILDSVIEFIEKTKWEKIGEKIGAFLADIDFLKIASKMGEALWKAINGAISMYSRTFSKAPVETALLSLLVIPKALKAIIDTKFVKGILELSDNFKFFAKTTKLTLSGLSGNKEAIKKLSDEFPKFGKVVGVAREAWSNFRFGIENKNFMTGLNEGITTIRNNLSATQKKIIGVTSVFAEFSLVKSGIYDIASGADNLVESFGKVAVGVGTAVGALKLIGLSNPWTAAITGATALISGIMGIEKAAQERKELELFGESVKALTERLESNAQAINERLKSAREMTETSGVAEAQAAQTLADQYFSLAEKQKRTNKETEQMKTLGEQLVKQFPQLEEKYNKETGLIDGTRNSVQKLIDAKLKEAQVEAVQSGLVEAYEAKNKAIEQANEKADEYLAAQREIAKAEANYQELLQKEGQGSKQAALALADLERLKKSYGGVTGGYEELLKGLEQADEDIAYYTDLMTQTASSSGGKAAKGYADNFNSTMSDKTKEIHDNLKENGEYVREGFDNGLKEGEENSKENAKSWMDGVVKSVKEFLGIKSPSRVFAEIGRYSMEGYNQGISENSSGTESKIKEFATNVVSWFTEGTSPVKDSAPINFEEAWEKIKETFTPSSDWFKEKFDNSYKSIKTVFNPIDTWFGEKWRTTKVNFKDTSEFFRKKFNDAYTKIKEVFSPITTWFHTKWSDVQKVFKGVPEFFREKFNDAYTAVTNIFNGIGGWFGDRWADIKKVFDKEAVSNFFKKAFGEAYKAVTKIWDKIGGYFKGIAKTIISPIEKTINGIIEGVNWVLGELGSKNVIEPWPAHKFAKGTGGLPRDTVGMVNDQKGSTYKELIVPPHGKPFIPEGRNIILPLEKGTKIMPARQTKEFMNAQGIPKFAKGIGEFFGNAWESVKKFTGDVMDYFDNPWKLVQIAFDKFIDTSRWTGVIGDIGSGAINTIFDSAVSYIKSLFGNSSIEKAVRWAIGIANDNSHGYDQKHRTGPDYDCSSLVTIALQKAGLKVGLGSTGTMLGQLIPAGFKDVTSKVERSSGKNMKRGDVLLKPSTSKSSGHTAIYVGNGKIVHARINEFGGVTGGKTGDQTGREIEVSPYHNHPWTYVLRYGKAFKNGVGKINIPDLIPKYSAGGFPEDGLFYKNSNEMITQVGGRTQVLNSSDTYDMIKQASYEGQMQAQREMIDYLSSIERNTRETADKDTTVRIDTRTLLTELDRRGSRNGFSFT